MKLKKDMKKDKHNWEEVGILYKLIILLVNSMITLFTIIMLILIKQLLRENHNNIHENDLRKKIINKKIINKLYKKKKIR